MNRIINDIRKKGIFLSKKKGQCLLTNPDIMDAIVDAAQVSEKDLIIDIGTGPGYTLTHIVPLCGYYVGVEIDRKCYEMAQKKAEMYDNCTLILGDILENKHTLNPEVIQQAVSLCKEYSLETVKVVANLPYNVATPVIMNLLIQNDITIDLMVVMVQKEIAHKLIAGPGKESYGAVGVVSRICSSSEIVFHVKKDDFFPRPKVSSTVLRIHPLKPEERQIPGEDIKEFSRFVKSIFNFPNKKILNSILNSHETDLDKNIISQRLEEGGVDPQRFISEYSPEELYSIYNVLIKQRN
jgi:16S rRNA (adenine1518-N6/adenine1519-N6)-dimethyltransferase